MKFLSTKSQRKPGKELVSRSLIRGGRRGGIVGLKTAAIIIQKTTKKGEAERGYKEGN